MEGLAPGLFSSHFRRQLISFERVSATEEKARKQIDAMPKAAGWADSNMISAARFSSSQAAKRWRSCSSNGSMTGSREREADEGDEVSEACKAEF